MPEGVIEQMGLAERIDEALAADGTTTTTSTGHHHRPRA